MAVKDWSFARLLVVLTVGAYLAAPGDDPLVRFWERNRWLLVSACAAFVASVIGLYALVAAW